MKKGKSRDDLDYIYACFLNGFVVGAEIISTANIKSAMVISLRILESKLMLGVLNVFQDAILHLLKRENLLSGFQNLVMI